MFFGSNIGVYEHCLLLGSEGAFGPVRQVWIMDCHYVYKISLQHVLDLTRLQSHMFIYHPDSDSAQ